MSARSVAIVGIGGLFPSAPDLSTFWSNILSKHSASQEVSNERWLLQLEDAYDPQISKPDKVYSRHVCSVDYLPSNTDEIRKALQGLDIDPEFMMSMDPVYLLGLLAAREAFDDTVTKNLNLNRVGVIIGNLCLPTEKASQLSEEILGKTFEEQVLSKLTDIDKVRGGAEKNVSPFNRYSTGLPGGIIAKSLRLGGGSYTLDAACASSLYALKLAVDEILSGRRDAMIAGGISRPDSLYTQMGFSQLRALSPNGICSPFDINGNGLLVGEGAGMFVLKRIENALEDGDHIYATIAGIGLSNDVEGSLLAPSSEGQLRAMRMAYKRANWDPSDVDLIECHATGTPVGDAIEFESMKTLWESSNFKKRQCVIGSVKSNIGHLLTAAGSAAIMKVLLAIKEKEFPPTANFSNAPDKLEMANSPFRILSESAPWASRKKNTARKAAISAFGFGGINAHVLLEEWIPPEQEAENHKPIKRIPKQKDTTQSIAIVGMDAHFGPWSNLRAFQERVLGGDVTGDPALPSNQANTRQWWGVEKSHWFHDAGHEKNSYKGFFLNDIDISTTRYRIPPNELKEMLPQQLLMLEVAYNAVSDYPLSQEDRLNTGVFIGLGLDLNSTNFSGRLNLINKAREWAEIAGLNLSEANLEKWIQSLRDSFGPSLSANKTMGALGSIVASRIAREFQFGGPSFSISSEDTSGLHALHVAISALHNGELDHAIVGAIDISGDVRSYLASQACRPFSAKGEAKPFDQNADGTILGEGAVVVILKRLEDAERDGNRIYSTIQGFGMASGGGIEDKVPTVQAYLDSLERACTEAKIPADKINLYTAHGSGNVQEDRMEAEALHKYFSSSSTRDYACSINSLVSDVGFTGAASGLAAVVKTSLALYQKILPPIRNLETPIESFNLPDNSNSILDRKFTLSLNPRFWLRNKKEEPRIAAVSSMSIDGNCGHVILKGYEKKPCERDGQYPAISVDVEDPPEQTQPLGTRPEALFAIEGNGVSTLLSKLDAFKTFVEGHSEYLIEPLARKWWGNQQPGSESYGVTGLNSRENIDPRQIPPLALTFVSRDAAELLEQISIARESLQSAPEEALGGNQSIIKNPGPDRIFFSPNPIGENGDLAFVFPGSGNHYLAMGRELSVQWPEIFRNQGKYNDYLRSQYQPEYFWDLDIRISTDDVIDQLNSNHNAMIFGQVAIGTAVSDLCRYLGIFPQAVIGYSLGESAGLFSLGAWTSRDAMLKRMEHSKLFTEELAGPCKAARRAWNLPPDKTVDWAVYVIDYPIAELKASLENSEKVYRLIVNTPRETVIGGDRKSVEQLIKKLGCRAFPLHGITTVHCEVAKEVEKQYHDLHLFDTHTPPGIAFYSGVLGHAYDVNEESAANSILNQAVKGFDFPKVINKAYEDGVRVFIEIGPGTSCSRMINSILGTRPHTTRPVCFGKIDGTDQRPHAVSKILRMLGQLIAERVPVDLSILYGRKSSVTTHQPPTDSPPLTTITVPLSGPSYTPPSPPKPTTLRTRTETEIPSPVFNTTPSKPTITQTIIQQAIVTNDMTMRAHECYLSFSMNMAKTMTRNIELQSQIHQQSMSLGINPSAPETESILSPPQTTDTIAEPRYNSPFPTNQRPAPLQDETQCFMDRAKCMEFAIGKIQNVLGEQYAEIDTYPTRVRLPDEPLMLCDRIVLVEGEPLSMSKGRCITEHDIFENAWYLDNGHIPTCIAVEAGQADLFLSGYLGADFEAKGKATYRLLDAEVEFHSALPTPGNVIRYDIHIDGFFTQSDTYLFRFHFEATIDGRPLLSMRKGCAGFFTHHELEAGQGVIHTKLDLREIPGKRPDDWKDLVQMKVESYNEQQVEALRRGDYAACFGSQFANLPLRNPIKLPGGLMNLVHRVKEVTPNGGRFGLGQITAEADIHPEDWFLVCHFCDDQVMPGTLMYECCMHTLRILMMRMGWVGDESTVVCGPKPGVRSQLKCRGQVIATTRLVTYQLTIKEIGYDPDAFVIADALMFADGKPVVEIINLSAKFTGLTLKDLQQLWSLQPTEDLKAPSTIQYEVKPAVYTPEQIVQFTSGSPSKAFGEPYKIFDPGQPRKIARLPQSPYQFLDRITYVNGEPFQMVPDCEAEAQYDTPPDAWYFDADRQDVMPFAVLLEVALQPCGWISSYVGSALTSQTDLKYRNLGGKATQYLQIPRNIGTLTTYAKLTDVSQVGGMILQNFEFEVSNKGHTIYKGVTNFGFFSGAALKNQVGMQGAKLYQPTDDEMSHSKSFLYPEEPPYPRPKPGPDNTHLRMIDEITIFIPDGGPNKLGFIRGTKHVNADDWFFQAHFFEDPVCPGSLGLESFQQLLKVVAVERWGANEEDLFESPALGFEHEWIYRGQYIQSNELVTVDAIVTSIDDVQQIVSAEGYLSVDGRIIYQMKNYTMKKN